MYKRQTLGSEFYTRVVVGIGTSVAGIKDLAQMCIRDSFSSDRTIREYAEDIWDIAPIEG